MQPGRWNTRAAKGRESSELAPGAGTTSAPVAPRRLWTRALVKTTLLSFVVSALALAVGVKTFPHLSVLGPIDLPWFVMAIGFVIGELLVFHIEVRREAITFPFGELPLTIGLFLASPSALVIGRLVGSAIVLICIERQSVRKIVLNVANYFAEVTVAVLVFHALRQSHGAAEPIAWLAVLIAVLMSSGTSFAMVTMAMRWHGAPIDLSRMIFTNTITAVTNTALGILAVILLAGKPVAILPLVFVGAIVVVAYRGYSSLHRRYSSLSLLYEFTRLVSGSHQPEDVLRSMLREARQLLRAEGAAMVFATGSEVRKLWRDGSASQSDEGSFPYEALAHAVADGHARAIARSTRAPQDRAILDALHAKDCIVAPIIEGNAFIGVLVVVDRETDVSTFDTDDGRLFETLANHASVALENGRLIERLHEQASEREHESLHDSLTGLPNRAHFHRALTEAIAAPNVGTGILSVALLDLDHFKEVNDTLGHHHGDLLLREVARRLRAALPQRAVLARLGGDEFAFFSSDFSANPRQLGVLVHQAFQEPFVLEGLALEIAGSIGLAQYPEHGTDPSTLLQRADVAMYEAKTSSTDHVEVYAPTRDVNTVRRLGLANDLRRAIETGELELFYQPKASMSDGVVHSAEALVRWRHPQLGLVPPDEFVPLAERTGLIQPFTHHVIKEGLFMLQRWSQDRRGLGLSINLSMRNLLDSSLATRVSRLLESSNIDPGLVTFEVTETSMMAEPTKTLKTLNALADLGVRLSIDDFGTGHSSLAYLQRLPVHELKIDKSFIQPLTTTAASRSIVESIIHLAHSLGLSVVAEGVEDQETWDALRRAGCDTVQGYLLGRPMPAELFSQWLSERSKMAAAASR